MEKREFEIKSEKIASEDIEKSLESLSKEDWEKSNWPLVTFVPKEVVAETDGGLRSSVSFWEKIFNPENFIYPNSKTSYDSEKHSLYILHSFSKPGQKDAIFKAITTSPKTLLKNPRHMINYKFHGKPCEDRSRGASSYPTCSDFWRDFFDKLPEKKQDNYPMPSSSWRKKFILEKYFNK